VYYVMAGAVVGLIASLFLVDSTRAAARKPLQDPIS
jgi:hypothetical protein